MVTAGEIRRAIALLSDDCEVILSIDVSPEFCDPDDEEEEFGKRAFAEELVDVTETMYDQGGKATRITVCFQGGVNF